MLNSEQEPKLTEGEIPVIYTIKLLIEIGRILGKLAGECTAHVGPYFRQELIDLDHKIFDQAWEESLFNPAERQRRIEICTSKHS